VPATRRPRQGLLFLFGVLACVLASTGAFAAPAHVELVTIGPGSDDLELYGHSALCVTADGAADGRCYDFGVPGGAGDETDLVWDTVRGKPRFVPVSVERSRLVEVFEDMERSLWVQDIPLDEGQAAGLQASLEAAVASQEAYAYHPYYRNCTTRLRDALDQATGGKLRQGADAPSSGPRFRVLSEQGFSGHLFELAGLALFLGSGADRQPTAWDAMFLPTGLRDAVAARLGAPPKQIYERREAVVPTSTQAGRVGLVLLGALLAGVIAYGTRKGRLRGAMGVASVLLGLLALVVDAVWLVSRIPEFGGNWVALVLLPTDAALAFVSPGLGRRYLGVRLGMLALLAVLSATGVIAQPLVAVCALAALPLGTAYVLLRRRRAQVLAAAPRPTARETTAKSASLGGAP
jgi:hypothetical protein